MFSLHRLSNGVRVVLAPQQDTQAVTVEALVPVGSRYETAALSGASHFVEHMMFKGTKRRPTTLAISRDLDRIGAEYNAFTGKEYTGYYIKANAEHCALSLDMLSDMLFRSTYAEAEFERERKVILEEINLYEDNPSMHLDDIFEGLLYHGHPLGRLISGTKETMLGITRSALVAYRDRAYHPQDLVLVIAGNIGSNALELAQQTFGAVRMRRHPRLSARAFTPRPSGPRVRLHWKETAQVHLALGLPTFAAEDARAYPLTLLVNILGGTMSSRLFIAVRERLGLAYSVGASADAYRDAGSLVVTAGLDPKRLPQAIRVILRELRRMSDRGVTTEELARAKDNIRGRMILSFEDSASRADWYGKQVLLRRATLTPEEKMARLAAVDRAAVAGIARAFLHPDRLHLAVIGPYRDEAPFRKLLQIA
ncbi:insulinase family protein [Candidatus Uhrbacteria bacterium]|nr:insulinase family protein [Candidatus Uhrbacteria bacterium]